jgi:hypothetical protein
LFRFLAADAAIAGEDFALVELKELVEFLFPVFQEDLFPALP